MCYSGCDDSPSCERGCEVRECQASAGRQRFGAGRASGGLGSRALAWMRPAGSCWAIVASSAELTQQIVRFMSPAALAARSVCSPLNRAARGFPVSSRPNNTTSDCSAVTRSVGVGLVMTVLPKSRKGPTGPLADETDEVGLGWLAGFCKDMARPPEVETKQLRNFRLQVNSTILPLTSQVD
jgi:hypothetical protein